MKTRTSFPPGSRRHARTRTSKRTLWISRAVLLALLLLAAFAVLRARGGKPSAVGDAMGGGDVGVRIESAWKWGYGLMRDGAATSVEQRNREEFELIGVRRVPNIGDPPEAAPGAGAVADARYSVSRGAWTAENANFKRVKDLGLP